MTILAQPNDCHSCNDARSIVQKKKVLPRVFTKAIVLYVDPFLLLFDKDGLIACFCYTYLTYYQLGGHDHSVLDTFVQLTEGRSARDQPKQPPAKKRRFDDRQSLERARHELKKVLE